ncbi:hypothetical protein EC32608_A0055 [Escherichia coli 3.2608]|nr:hypothetical protein G2583_pO550139 [Escherichia coli O55:H7 str. CB9615]EIH53269.1 hypothetical protein EC32608_A0055 [Escherichia coli 3.2608]EIH68743.1 hypothetical protein EC930624_A0071 [Escherichia coli 93.0624]
MFYEGSNASASGYGITYVRDSRWQLSYRQHCRKQNINCSEQTTHCPG